MRILQMLGKLQTEALRLRQHADQPPLDRLGRAPDEFWLGLHFAAAFGSGLAQRRAQYRFIQAELLRNPRGPLGAQDSIGDSLNVRQKKIPNRILRSE